MSMVAPRQSQTSWKKSRCRGEIIALFMYQSIYASRFSFTKVRSAATVLGQPVEGEPFHRHARQRAAPILSTTEGAPTQVRTFVDLRTVFHARHTCSHSHEPDDNDGSWWAAEFADGNG
ncbi:unnamed protein product [Amoebophrya sp. A25]|nr:unnamed protein product [Amoebophrya sp. A25]|eukprot:GSA25T00001956001.1